MILLKKTRGMSAGDLDLGAGNKLCRKQKCECVCSFPSSPSLPRGEDPGLTPSVSSPHLHCRRKAVLDKPKHPGLK